MNKRFCSLVVIAVVLFTAGVFAQISVQPGIAAGINSFTQKVDAPGMTITPDSKMGFVAGAVLDISLMDLISIEPGLMYTMRGMARRCRLEKDSHWHAWTSAAASGEPARKSPASSSASTRFRP